MKAALFDKSHALSIVSRELRDPKADEIVVRVEACGVCGTDLHIVEGSSRSTPPVVLGHEYAGIIAGLGARVEGFSVGERVAIDPNIACGHCFFCRKGETHLCTNLKALGVDLDGGMAEYSVVPALQVHKVPEALSAEAAAFIEPVSCAVHGIDRARIRAGDTVAIVGAGTIGLLMLQLVKSAGAARTIVIEPLAPKQMLAREVGADIVLAPGDAVTAVRDFTRVGADVVIECVGKVQSMQQAISLARRGGTVMVFGVCSIGEKIQVEPNEIYFRELTIVGSYVNPHTFSRAIALLAAGVVSMEKFTLSIFDLEDVHAALSYLREGKSIKSIVHPSR